VVVSTGQAVAYAWAAARPELMDITSVSDGRTHTITAEDFERGLMQGWGRYRAVCGTGVLVAAMATGPGPQCAGCCEVLRGRERAAARPGPLVRMARRLRAGSHT
jgi:hypothetical protein